MSNNRPQVPDSAMTGDALESSQKPAGGPINVAAAPASNLEPEESGIREPVSAAAPISGHCVECRYETIVRHDDEWLCSWCHEAIVRGQKEDQRLDDPRHGQAAEINRRR